MSVIDSFIDYFASRMPLPKEQREEDVYDMRYRYRNFSLFPEDLNADYDPYDFIEEPVEPKSFRKILTAVLGWTVLIPLILFFMLHQRHIETLSSLFDDRQLLIANLAKKEVEESLISLPTRVANIVYLNLSAHKDDGHPNVSADALFTALNRTIPVRYMAVDDRRRGVRYVSGWPAMAGAASGKKTPGEEADYFVIERKSTGEAVLGISVREPQDGLEIYVEVPLTLFQKLLGSALPETGLKAALYDQNGEVITANDEEAEPKPLDINKVKEKVTASGAVWATSPIRHEAVDRACVKLDSVDWYIAVDQQQLARDAEMRDDIIMGSVLFLIAVASVFFVGFLMGRPLSRGVGELSDELDAFVKVGKLPEIPKTLSQHGPTELLEFAERFRTMAQEVGETQRQLRSMNQLLEKRVGERTEELGSRNAELATLQRLLTPIEAPLDRLIEETVVRFRQVLGLDKLHFHSVRELREKKVPAEEFLNTNALVQIRVENQVFGWLETTPDALQHREIQNSLDRLANSIGIVLTNRRLLVSTVRQHRILTEVFSSMNEGVVLLDADGFVVEKNACLETLLGELSETMTFPEMVAERFEVKLRSADGTPAQTLSSEALVFEAGSSYFLNPKRNGAQKTSESTKTETGKVLVATAFDVQSTSTESQSMVLGLMVRDISSHAEMERMKDQLISIVAHELKTPITALRLQAETLVTQIGLSEEEREEILRDMQEESFRLRRIVDDWLDITRFRDGLIHLTPKVMHIATPIDRAAKLVQARFELTVHRTIEPECECFRFDPERITQVFINLFSNAARYRHEDKVPAVSVRVTKEGSRVRIVVEDKGTGIAKDKLPYIFERFYQADMSIARKRGGTGLGLAIVKGIVEAHGGSIRAESRLGEWTRFVIMLPY